MPLYRKLADAIADHPELGELDAQRRGHTFARPYDPQAHENAKAAVQAYCSANGITFPWDNAPTVPVGFGSEEVHGVRGTGPSGMPPALRRQVREQAARQGAERP